MKKLSSELEKFLEINKGKKIVFTNGCFDILHAGHVAYLNEAHEQGDLLIVGLNSDSSVRGLKGESRPIINETERKFVLENLKSVDFVELFPEETLYELIKLIQPDVLCKGGDWSTNEIVGSDIVLKKGGEVKSLMFKEGFSTTNIIEEILKREK